MADITIDWLKKKGFNKNERFFEKEIDGVLFGFDLINGLCWVDGDDVYAMKKADTEEDVKAIYAVCGFDLKFNRIEAEKDGYPITPAWLAMSGFNKKGEHKWVLTQNRTIKYNTDNNVLSVINGKQGFEGVVKTEDFARKIIDELFVDDIY